MLDATQRIGRIKGSQQLGGISGSISMDLSDGTPFWSFQPDFLFRHISGISPVPVVTISASAVTWTYSSPPKSNYIYPITGWLFWGVY
ncbi:hypothetical protein [Paraburkholderia dilworthii]|uniref:Uncharacterized protein n=1 Tax=Paraburkholderia dilworthii TaxID=948106 RepID=A0ABW9DAQ9_9BURK